MLIDFQLKNFRCFQDTKINGFQRVNLIGGKNNSGKTALLEALFLYISPDPKSIIFLKQLRNEFFSINQKFPQITWESFFFNKNTKSTIQLIGYNKEQEKTENNSFRFPRIVTLNTNERERKLNPREIVKLNMGDTFENNRFFNLHICSEVDLKGKKDKKDNLQFKTFYTLNTEDEKIESFKKEDKLSAQGKFYQTIVHDFRQLIEKKTIFCLSSFNKISKRELAKNFDSAILNDKYEQILNILQKLDSSIAEIRSLTINEPDIYLRRKGENFLPISLFGDCFNRVLDIILRIINTKNSVCLIDEIENGIHYQNQREFWQSLFKLAVELDIQIFATTHSLEMIQAFADVGLHSYPDVGAYFEVARNEETNQIVGIKRDLELLQYSLKHEEGVGLRGE